MGLLLVGTLEELENGLKETEDSLSVVKDKQKEIAKRIEEISTPEVVKNIQKVMKEIQLIKFPALQEMKDATKKLANLEVSDELVELFKQQQLLRKEMYNKMYISQAFKKWIRRKKN